MFIFISLFFYFPISAALPPKKAARPAAVKAASAKKPAQAALRAPAESQGTAATPDWSVIITECEGRKVTYSQVPSKRLSSKLLLARPRDLPVVTGFLIRRVEDSNS